MNENVSPREGLSRIDTVSPREGLSELRMLAPARV